MWHLYALTAGDPGPLVATSGIGRSPLASFAAGGLHAVASSHPTAPRATIDAALAHARVVEELIAHASTLPVRFGSHHVDGESLIALLHADHDRLLRGVARVGDHVEFAVRLHGGQAGGPDPDDAAEGGGTAASARAHEPGAGRAYLESRSRQDRQRRRLEAQRVLRLDRATAELDPLAADSRTLTTRGGPERCFLVALDRTMEFERAAAALVGSGRMRTSGPHPPFTFATGGVGA